MKSLLIGCSALALNAAHAQSGVQIHGVLDAFAQHLNAHTSLHGLQSGGLSASRMGLRGHEYLGNAVEAFFALEGGLHRDESTLGQGGALFGRQSIVGLRGHTWGGPPAFLLHGTGEDDITEVVTGVRHNV